MPTRAPIHPLRRRLPALCAAALGLAALTGSPAAAQLATYRAAIFDEGNIAFFGPSTDDRFAFALATGDFDGDGAEDLATGIPFDDNFGALYPNSGIVIVRYGVPGTGLAPGLATNVLTQAYGGSPDPPENSDHFGWALAAGDFDGDGSEDLAVGGRLDGPANAGAVQVYYGSPSGLLLTGVQLFHQGTAGISGDDEGDDLFGTALAVGDFDADGFADLAIGIPGEDDNFISFDNGRIVTLYGSVTGLSAARSQQFSQDVPPEMLGSSEDFDEFGAALAAGDFDGDGFTDLAIGVPGENTEGGRVAVVFGSASGLTAVDNESWDQDTAGVADDREDRDDFGSALAAGDLDGDGFDDLAIGVPNEDLDTASGPMTDAGAVHVLRGDAAGLTTTGASFWTQDSAGIFEAAGAGDHFGAALAFGDFAHDGWSDLVVGAWGETGAVGSSEGVVHVIQSDPVFGGLAAIHNQIFIQGLAGLPGQTQADEQFGWAVTTADFDGSGHADLVIGAPQDNAVVPGAGAEWVLYGSLFADGFESGNASRWSATVP